MTEQYRDIGQIDKESLTQALVAPTRDVRDVAHGDGQAVDIAGKTTLEIFPGAGVARVTTDDARFELFRLPGYTVDVDANRVTFRQSHEKVGRQLVVGATGDVHLYPLREPTQRRLPPKPTSDPSGDGAASQDGVQGATDAPESTGQDETKEQDQVTLRGRLGRDPWYRDLDDGPKAAFPLAVHDEEGVAHWHRVVVFDDLARQVSGSRDFVKGREVDATGKHVVNEYDSGKKYTEFHASDVVRVRSTPARPRQQR